MTQRNIKAWYLAHKWTSLVCTAFLLMLCLTGLPLIFHIGLGECLATTTRPEKVPPARRQPTSAATAPTPLRGGPAKYSQLRFSTGHSPGGRIGPNGRANV